MAALIRISGAPVQFDRGVISSIDFEVPLLTALLDQFGYQSCPSGLVTRADSGAIVPMKIFIEQDQILPVRIAVENLSSTRRWAPAVLAA